MVSLKADSSQAYLQATLSGVCGSFWWCAQKVTLCSEVVPLTYSLHINASALP